MAGEDAELIGGISVSVGASHSKLVSDLAEADRLLEQWAQRKVTVTLNAQMGQMAGGGGGGGAPQRQQPPPSVVVGSAARTRAQAAQAETNLQKAINAELAKTGETYNAITGEIESATSAIVAQKQVVTQVQQQAAQSTPLNIDTKTLQNELQAVLTTLREIVAVAAEAAKAVPAAGTPSRGGGAGGGRRRGRAASGSDEEGEQQGNQGGRVAMLYQPRTAEYQGGPFGNQGGRIQQVGRPISTSEYAGGTNQGGPIRYLRTPQGAPGIDVQRNFSVVVSPQQRAEEQRLRTERRAEEARLREARRQQAANELQARRTVPEPIEVQGGPTSTTFAPPATDESRARDAARRRAARQPTDVERQRREDRDRVTAERANLGLAYEEATGTGGRGGGGRGYRRTDEDVAQREQQRIATQEAQRVSAGRTARTQASGLGSFFFGGGRAQVEAQAALAAANERVAIAQRRLNDPEVLRSVVARRHATEELTVAQNEQAEALKKIESFSGVAAGARNLLAITAAGTAFGIGLQAITIGAKAAEKAVAPYIDQISGYAQKTADYTTALADQARAQQGNARGVTELKLAQAGFASSTAATLQPIIAQRAQIEAGNKALVEQIETFRIAENIRKAGGTAGLGGSGTGGVGGTSLFGIPSTGEQTGNFLGGLNQQVRSRQRAAADQPLIKGAEDPLGRLFSQITGQVYTNPALGITGKPRSQTDQEQLNEATAAFGRGLSFVNDQLKQGGKAATQFAQGGTATQVEQTAAAFDALSPEMAKAIRDAQLYSSAIAGSSDPIRAATEALRALNIAGTLTGPGEQLAAQRIAQQNARNSIDALRAQQAYEKPAFISGVGRQIGISQQQLSAQEALQNLANPLPPVGTGRVAANAKEQRQINAETRDTQKLQDELNAGYAEGKRILTETYKPAIIANFGAAAGQVFSGLLTQIESTGNAIASTQAKISNEQAAYQVAQYNYQLHIAERTLSDIGGLTGKNFGAGKSYLGVLEGQNLALSRQAQLLQFGLSQRQINFQKAIAGFTVPGLTPAEQNARIQEAKTEAEYAQKQLDIQKKMFGNQVKIVDISNLRQGADLVRQIALLQQGRQVTIDTQAAQEKLDRLNKRQQQLVARVGTYITAIDQVVAKASADMAAQEQILGRSLTKFESQAVVTMYHVGEAFFRGLTGGLLSQTSGGSTTKNAKNDERHASGGIFTTQGETNLGPYGIAGEANKETVAILRNPRALSGGLGGDGGNATVNFNGDMVFKTEADFQRLYRMVLSALGRDAATKGLRTPF